MSAIMTGGMSLGQASPSLNAFAAGQATAYKIFETINRKPEINSYDTSGTMLEDINGDIELRDVYFSYPARPDIQVFSGFSLHVPSGMTVALVGESGSGKSTVISLLERFYDPQTGEVLIDGINLKKLQLRWIREKIGLVSQEPILFMTSIKENIAYSKAGATFEEIRTVIELANAARFIDKMPQGLDTMVGEHGTRLSGGQKQRIAIARAILKDPKILLLDEATSALDATSERIVQEALVRIMLNRTTVVVAHRLSTVRNVDMIAVMRQGKIVEQGSHSELIKDSDEAYSQLIRLQEENNQVEQVPAIDPDEIESSFDNGKVFDQSRSQRSPLKLSKSKGSSGESRTPSPISFGLTDAVSFSEGIQEGGELHVGTHHKGSIKQLAYLNKPELPVLLLGSLAAVTNGLIFPVFGSLLSSAIYNHTPPPPELQKGSVFWAFMFAALGIISMVALPLQEYLFGVAGGKLIRRVGSLSFERVVHQEISWFDEPTNSSGAIGTRLLVDSSAMRSIVGDALAVLVQIISTITAGLVIAMVANWRLALLILALLPLVGLQGYAQLKFEYGFSADAKVMYEEVSQIANDAVSSIQTVVSFCAEKKVIDLYKKKCEASMKDGVRQGIVSGLGFGFSNFVLFSIYSFSFYAGARFVEDGKATFSQVFRVFFALTMAALGVSQTSAVAPDTAKAKESIISIFAILDRKSKIDSSNDEGATLPNIKGDIEFEHVTFKYPTRPDTVAIVGEWLWEIDHNCLTREVLQS